MSSGKIHGFDELKRLGELGLRLAGEADDDIGGDGNLRDGLPAPPVPAPRKNLGVVLRAMRFSTVSLPDCSGRCRWRHNRRSCQSEKKSASRSQGSSEDRRRRATDVRASRVDIRSARCRGAGKSSSPRTKVDACQHDLLRSAIQRRVDIGENRLHRAAAAGTARQGGDAESAGIVAAILDFDEGACSGVQAGQRLAGQRFAGRKIPAADRAGQLPAYLFAGWERSCAHPEARQPCPVQEWTSSR